MISQLAWKLLMILRNNRALFIHVPTRQISDQEVQEIEASIIEGAGLLDAAFDEETQQSEEETSTKLDQLSSEIETLSLVPKSRWQTLLHLDVIKVGMIESW
jgi:U3 small nucleolar RNA-associated protein 21